MAHSTPQRLWHLVIAFLMALKVAVAHDGQLKNRDESTTTITLVATTSAGAAWGGWSAYNWETWACKYYTGACVVYGGWNGVTYTTTIYETASPTPTGSEATTTVTENSVTTTTVSNAGACENYNGACVVYETTAGQQAVTTVYVSSGSGSSHSGEGNSGGYIGTTDDGSGDGEIGGAAGLDRRWTFGVVALAVAFAALIAW